MSDADELTDYRLSKTLVDFAFKHGTKSYLLQALPVLFCRAQQMVYSSSRIFSGPRASVPHLFPFFKARRYRKLCKNPGFVFVEVVVAGQIK